MDQYEREEYAVKRKIARAKLIDPMLEMLGRRKKGDELTLLAEMVNCSHELLTTYDGLEEPPPLTGIVETQFDAALTRLAEVIDERSKKPA